MRAKALMMHGFLSLYNGYDVQRIFVEAFNERDRRFYSGSAFLEIAPSGGSTASYLLVLTRERVLSLDIHPLLPIFTNAASKYRFSFGEQSLLARALEGHTDEELAQLLSLSLSAIKKRWVKIFERVDSALPELSDGRCHGQKRGAQKRHLLLRYLRNHPEELRSFSRSRK